MIKLQPTVVPPELTNKLIQSLTEEYKSTGKAVWQRAFFGEALLLSSHSKCCFSECKLNEEGKYDEIEHFHPKSLYPDEVVVWTNLLPISKACNIAKSDHDTKAEPIINPYTDDPKDHIYFKNYRFYGKTELGQRTVEVVGLNDWQTWVVPRFDVGKGIFELLEVLHELALQYDANPQPTVRFRNNLMARLRGLMVEGTEKYVYSAVVATILLNERKFFSIKDIFQRNSLWLESFEILEDQMRYCALDTNP
jgi:hypothetical protein